jgi:alkanesulfonate monooxygenase
MTVQYFWTLPPAGDGRDARSRGDHSGVTPASSSRAGFTDERARRFDYYDYLLQTARAAELSGFHGAFVPWQPNAEDPWIVVSDLARRTRRLRLLPELAPAFATPVYLAKMAASFQRLSQNRLDLKIDLEREPSVRRAHGDFLAGAEWFERAGEYLTTFEGVWTTRPYDFRGKFYDVEAGGLESPLSAVPRPRLFTSGQSDEALSLAAAHADVHLLPPFDLDGVGHDRGRLERAFDRAGRKPKLGVRLRVVARHTEEEAFRDNDHAVPGIALAGSYARVASRLEAYARLGVELFVLDAQPRLEEAYRFGEHVLPRLSSRFETAPALAAV